MNKNHGTQLDSMLFPTLMVTEQNGIIDGNSHLVKLLAVPIEKLQGKNLFKVFILEKQSSDKDFVPDVAALTMFTAYSAKFLDQGELVPVTLIPSAANDDHHILIQVALDDDREATRILLNNRLSRLRRAVNGANIGTWELNIGAKSDFFSEKFRELIGVNIETLFTWEKFREMIFVDDLPIFDVFFQSHIKRGVPLNFEFRMLINGEIRWFELKGEVLSEHGAPSIIMGSLTDSTQSKQILTALNEAIQSKNIAMEAGNIGTWHAELDGKKEWQWSWDKLTAQMYGLLPEDTGKLEKWIERLHPRDASRIIYAMEESLSSGKLFHQPFRITLPNGEIRYFIGTGKVGQNIKGEHFRIDGICIDQSAIHQAQTELKQLNIELEKRVTQRTKELVLSKEHAEQASKIKTDFLSMMSHELRTPMNGVIGSLDLLTTTKQTEESMDLIDTAKTSAENLVFILNDILDINKIEAGKLEIEDRAFSISEIIDNVVKVYIPIAKKKNIVFEVYEDPTIPMFVSGDSMRVRQILFNLLGNAVKFTTTTTEKIGKIKLYAEVKESNEYVSSISFNIIDNGIGIDKDTQQKLFMPFSQAERSTTRKYGGTGLGLAICAKLTEMMGGSITLTSEKGEGSSFRVEVPFWLSQETNALAVETLSSVNVAFVDVSGVESERKDVLAQYLVAEGAEVNYVAHDLNFDFSADFDVILIFVGELSDGRVPTELLLSQLGDHNKVTLAIDDSHLDESRKIFPGKRIVTTQPITRVQFLGAINHVWQKSHELVLDELDLEGLGFDLEEETTKAVKAGILIVEDNPLNQKLILKQMSNLGYECDLANDGEEGIQMWQDNDYKLILTDCHMPKVDGYQMTQAIRKLETSTHRVPIAIVAVTGAAMSGDAERCYKAGMNSFVSKPVQLSDLRTVLKEWYHND